MCLPGQGRAEMYQSGSLFHSLSGLTRRRVRTWVSDRDLLVLLALLVIHLIPIWAFNYFPSQDGPVHLENANIIRQYYRPEGSLFREYYLINKSLSPNWLGQLVLAGLMSVVPALIAEKIFLSCYVILFPVSVLYALRSLQREAGFLVLLAFPLVYHYPLHMGFYNFTASLPFFFLVVGYWLRHWDGMRLYQTVVLSLMSLLVYFLHPVSLAMVYLWISVLMLWHMAFDLVELRDSAQIDIHHILGLFKKKVVPSLLALLPSFFLFVTFVSSKGVQTILRQKAWRLIGHLFSLSSIVTYEKNEYWFSTALVCLFAVIFFRFFVPKLVERRFSRWDGLLVAALVSAMLYFAMPSRISAGGNINLRLGLYPYFALLLWFGTQPYKAVAKKRIEIIAIGIACALLGLHTSNYSKLNDYVKEYTSGINLIADNSTVLPLVFSKLRTPGGERLTLRTCPVRHASGYIAILKNVVEFDNYQARLSHFPVNFRSELNPFIHIDSTGSLESIPPRANFLSYPERTGGRVNYVLLWGLREEHREIESTKAILEQLDAGYQLIYISPHRGLMRLYRRKGFQ